MTKDNLSLIRSGQWMNGFAKEFAVALGICEEQCFKLNSLPPSHSEERNQIIRNIMGNIGEHFTIHSPFHCDFGTNIHIGENFISNFNLTILDEADVTIGNNVFIGPDCRLCTVIHALKATQRTSGVMRARPITIGNDVWIAAGVTVLPGVNIGDGAVIGAGRVVTKDIPPHTLAAGNPCHIIREITDEDKVDIIS